MVDFSDFYRPPRPANAVKIPEMVSIMDVIAEEKKRQAQIAAAEEQKLQLKDAQARRAFKDGITKGMTPDMNYEDVQSLLQRVAMETGQPDVLISLAESRRKADDAKAKEDASIRKEKKAGELRVANARNYSQAKLLDEVESIYGGPGFGRVPRPEDYPEKTKAPKAPAEPKVDFKYTNPMHPRFGLEVKMPLSQAEELESQQAGDIMVPDSWGFRKIPKKSLLDAAGVVKNPSFKKTSGAKPSVGQAVIKVR